MQEKTPVQMQEETTVEPLTVTAPARLVPYKEIKKPESIDWNDVSKVKPIAVSTIDPNAPYMGAVRKEGAGLSAVLQDFRQMSDHAPADRLEEDGVKVGVSTRAGIGIGFTWGGSPGLKGDSKPPEPRSRRSVIDR